MDRRTFLKVGVGTVAAVPASTRLVSAIGGAGRFPLVAAGRAVPLVVSSADRPGVLRVVDDLRADVERVTGVRPPVSHDHIPAVDDVVDAAPQTVNVTTATGADDTGMNRQWERNTSDNVNCTSTRHTIGAAGRHVLKVRMVDPTVVAQKIVVDTGGLRPSYLGPPESTEVRRQA